MLNIVQASIKAFISRLANFRSLNKSDYLVEFVHEGNIFIRLPISSWFDALTGRGDTLSRNISYFHRPNAEALLRRLIYGLYTDGYISADKSIIVIGSWISDNSVIWGKWLNKEAFVFAIDPSPENHPTGKK